MNAVIYRGNRIISVEQRPVPKIQHPKDIIVKVRYTALCGRFVVPSLTFVSRQLLRHPLVIYMSSVALKNVNRERSWATSSVESLLNEVVKSRT